MYRPRPSRPFRVFVDSDWGTKFSISGAVFDFMGCAVHWFSKTQRSVSLSSTEAEWFAASMAARDGIYLRDLQLDLGLPVLRTLMRSDNKSVRDLSVDPVAFKKTKHILRSAEYLRDLCHRLFYQVVWIRLIFLPRPMRWLPSAPIWHCSISWTASSNLSLAFLPPCCDRLG